MGYGDDIMATGFARIAKQKYPNLQVVIGNRQTRTLHESIIFNNNPNITKVSDINPSINLVWIENYPGKRPYIKSTDENKIYWNHDYRAIKGDLYFFEEEMNKAISAFKKINEEWDLKYINKKKKIVFIEPSRKIKNVYKDPNLVNTQLGELNKDWGFENWKKLINSFQDEILFIRSVYEGSKHIEGVYEFESDFRSACAMMSLCNAFIGFEGGFSHAAAALNKKAVILFGGWIHPKITGYNIHTNIYIDTEDSPCGMRNYCEHCNKCRSLMKVKMVKEKLLEIL